MLTMTRRDVTENEILCAATGQLYQKAISGPVLSLGTFPTYDYAGDYVEPGKGDWSTYTIPFGSPGAVFGPCVNWTHGCPIGTGEVSVKQLEHDGKITPVDVLKTTFFETTSDITNAGIDLRRRNPKTNRSWDKEPPYTVNDILQVSSQAEILIRDEVATGVSIEFDVDKTRKGASPGEGDWWDMENDSILENRKAQHFRKWRGHGYAHARKPVNPGCHTLEEAIATLPEQQAVAIEKAIRVAQTGRLPNGELACEIIIKAFTDLNNYTTRSRGMVLVDSTPPTQTSAAQTDATASPPGNAAAPVRQSNSPMSNGLVQSSSPVIETVETPKPPTIQTLTVPVAHPTSTTPSTPLPPVIVKGYYDGYYSSPGILTELPSRGCRAFINAAQSLLDIANCLENDAGESDDLSVRKFAKKEAARLKNEAGVFKARALKLKAKLDGAEGDEEWDDEDADLSMEDKAIICADDGTIIIKSFPNWKPRRMSIANITEISPDTGPSPEVIVSTEDQAVIDAQYKVVIKAINQKKRVAKELMEAAIANGRI